MPYAVKSFEIQPRSLAFSGCATLQEFLAGAELYGPLMRKRLDEVRLGADDQLFLATYPDQLHLLALVSANDPDTVAVLPVIAQMAAASFRIELRVARDDGNLESLAKLLTEMNLPDDLEELDLPQLFIFDDEWQMQEQWGPRPQAADPRLDEWLERHAEYEALTETDDETRQEEYVALLDELVHEMRLWYNSGLNQACIGELRTLLAGLQTVDDETNS